MVFCINTIVADHLKVLVRDMYNQTFDKVGNGNTIRDDFMVLMALIVECHGIPVIAINPGSGNDGPAQVSADIFNGDIRGTQIKPGVKFSDLLSLEKIRRMTSLTEWNRQLRREWSWRKKMWSSSGMVKTQCLWIQETSLQDIRKVRF